MCRYPPERIDQSPNYVNVIYLRHSITFKGLELIDNMMTFILHLHLSDAFIQSDLQCIQAIHVFVSTCSLGIEPTTFVLLTQCSTTEPQEHFYMV